MAKEKPRVIYEDESIEVRSKKKIEIIDIPESALSCITAGLIGFKTYCHLAADPLQLWAIVKKDILKSVQIMEDILSENK